MKVDKGSMASSIEARVPYLDHKLVEFAYSLPQNFKLNGSLYNSYSSNEKYILRELAKKYLSQDTAARKKRGFMLPMNDVINGDIDKVKQYLLSDSSIGSKILGSKTVENLFKDKGEILNMQNEYFIWRLFILEVWSSVNKIK
jgi:asparagine synthase (glutamine-hydrolysing)